MYDADGQACLFDRDSYAGKTSPAPSARARPRGRTSGSSSRRSVKLVAIPYMSLDLTPGHGNLLGESYWEILSPWLGESWTLNTGVSPREGRVCSLSRILEDSPPRKYYLSRKACLGILRRARERGKPLPPQLEAALKAQAGLTVYLTPLAPPLAFHMNQRDEAIDLGETAGALMATSNMQMQTFVTAFAADQRDEVRDLHDVAGAPAARPGIKQQTFVAGVVSKGNGDCFLTPERHTALSAGGGMPGQGYPCVPTSDCLTPWDTQQTRVFTPEGTAPTLAGADGCGGRNPGGLIFAAGFCAGAGPSAGGIGYHEELAPTLKAAPSGNMMPSVLCMNRQNGAPAQTQRSGLRWERRSSEMSKPLPSGGGEGYGACDDAMMPSVLCLNDQGGSVMECSEDVSGTLRAQEHGHQPLVFENHGIDARYTGPHSVSPTITARFGTGGNNTPIVSNAVFSRQRVDVFHEGDVVSTQSARQYKDATDLIYQKTVGALTTSDSKGPNTQYVSSDKLVVEAPLLIRRLTPRECERLQGFPDDWTALPGAADSPRYRALGNSVAIPCVEFLMRGMALALLAG